MITLYMILDKEIIRLIWKVQKQHEKTKQNQYLKRNQQQKSWGRRSIGRAQIEDWQFVSTGVTCELVRDAH